jgi:predicted aspartyl protease
VIVPLSVEHLGLKQKINMLLDTGASICVIYRSAAANLNIAALAKGLSTVAGGQKISSELGRVDLIRVGPIVVLDREGPLSDYDGLLGMNYLKWVE